MEIWLVSVVYRCWSSPQMCFYHLCRNTYIKLLRTYVHWNSHSLPFTGSLVLPPFARGAIVSPGIHFSMPFHFIYLRTVLIYILLFYFDDDNGTWFLLLYLNLSFLYKQPCIHYGIYSSFFPSPCFCVTLFITLFLFV